MTNYDPSGAYLIVKRIYSDTLLITRKMDVALMQEGECSKRMGAL